MPTGAEVININSGPGSVTVLIPVLNGQEFIRDAMDSVLMQPEVTEVLVIDNGSNDDTIKILASYCLSDNRVKVLVCHERGVANALNFGLTQANGSLIARLDADDVMNSSRIHKQLQTMNSNSEIVLIASQITFIDSKGAVTGKSKYPIGEMGLFTNFLFRNPIAHPSVMFRKDIAISSGGYNPIYEGAEDLDLWLRMIQYGKFLVSPECLTFYRVHAKQVTVKNNLYTFEFRLRLNIFSRPISNTLRMRFFSFLQILRLCDLLIMKVSFLKNIRRTFRDYFFK
jgi:glycosyltransferase involved in cell wall biosynthesis